MAYGIIYCCRCILNGKVYIGKTKQKDFEQYFRKHISMALLRESTRPFYRAIQVHGKDSFKFEILCECDSQDELDAAEIRYIEMYNSYVNAVDSNGYNATLGGDGGRGQKWSSYSKQLLSNSLKNSARYKESRERLKGVLHTEEHKRKISEAASGELNGFYGRVHTEISKQKMSSIKRIEMTQEEIDDILILKSSGLSYKKIAIKYNVSPYKIVCILKENGWQRKNESSSGEHVMIQNGEIR